MPMPERKWAHYVEGEDFLVVDTHERFAQLKLLAQRYNTTLWEVCMQILAALRQEDPLKASLERALDAMENGDLTLEQLIAVQRICTEWLWVNGHVEEALQGRAEQEDIRGRVDRLLARTV